MLKKNVLILFIFFFILNNAKKRRSAFDRAYSKKSNFCDENICSHLKYYESENCVYQCISVNCFEELYKLETIEDGEKDYFKFIFIFLI